MTKLILWLVGILFLLIGGYLDNVTLVSGKYEGVLTWCLVFQAGAIAVFVLLIGGTRWPLKVFPLLMLGPCFWIVFDAVRRLMN